MKKNPSSTQSEVSKYHFPRKEIGFCEEIADLGQEMSRISLELLVILESKDDIKIY